MQIELVLASQSPRRRQLIQLLGYPVHALTAVVDEDSITHPDPAINAIKTAELKANAIAEKTQQELSAQMPQHTLIIAADTIVAIGNKMLGKPVNEDHAVTMLRSLRNRMHHVHTGVTIYDLGTKQKIQAVHSAVVTMRNYTDAEIVDYIATSDPIDKAGAYGIQHPEFNPVAKLEGCFLGVMGLSICQLIGMLARLDIVTLADLTAVSQAHKQHPCPILNQLNTQ